MATEIVEKELSYQIMQAAFRVQNTLGPGFLEKIYEEAMVIELEANGHKVERQKRIEIFYEGKKIGEHVMDLVVDERVVLELKTVNEITPLISQVALSYLHAIELPLAIILNFASMKVEQKRVVNTKCKTKQ